MPRIATADSSSKNTASPSDGIVGGTTDGEGGGGATTAKGTLNAVSMPSTRAKSRVVAAGSAIDRSSNDADPFRVVNRVVPSKVPDSTESCTVSGWRNDSPVSRSLIATSTRGKVCLAVIEAGGEEENSRNGCSLMRETSSAAQRRSNQS